MRLPTSKKLALALLVGALAPIAIVAAPPAQAIPVFDSANYAQNLLTAAHTLQQIDQQIRSLQNEAAMLANMDKHLRRFDFPELQQLKDNLAKVEELMNRAQGVDFGVDQLEARMSALFPQDLAGMSRVSGVANAKARLDAAMAAYRRTLGVQARIVANIGDDARLLTDLSARSSAAEGSLQIGQATNQLLALAGKQQMQLQQMLAAQFQAESFDRARAAQSEAEARARTRRFLGNGKAYAGN